MKICIVIRLLNFDAVALIIFIDTLSITHNDLSAVDFCDCHFKWLLQGIPSMAPLWLSTKLWIKYN